ncbi:MAG: TIGR00282 family metallophosphoesterase [Nitrospirae bacterium]|nr:TIGR00282 family metallophosphoesterase [Nitrospirota bacterium]
MNILFIGDIIGSPGRKALKECLPALVEKYASDLIIANGENAAGGFGITQEVAGKLFKSGVDVITSGNHIWDKKEVYDFLNRDSRLLRPANYPDGAPGVGYGMFITDSGIKVCVMNLAGRVFMTPIDCPFQYAKKRFPRILEETKVLIIDFHAEATSEKIAFGRMVDGQASAVIGTHTHVQTADEKILPGGTAYITDAGMTGPDDSVIGVEVDPIIDKFMVQTPRRFEVAKGPWRLNAVSIMIDEETGRAISIERINMMK